MRRLQRTAAAHLARRPLPEHRDGGPDVAAVVAELQVLADRREHPVRVLHVPGHVGISCGCNVSATCLLSNTVRFFQMTLAGQRGAFLQAILAPHTSSSWVIV